MTVGFIGQQGAVGPSVVSRLWTSVVWRPWTSLSLQATKEWKASAVQRAPPTQISRKESSRSTSSSSSCGSSRNCSPAALFAVKHALAYSCSRDYP